VKKGEEVSLRESRRKKKQLDERLTRKIRRVRPSNGFGDVRSRARNQFAS